MKKLLILLLTLVVAGAVFGGPTPEPKEAPAETPAETPAEKPMEAAQPTIKNPDTVVYATIGDMESLDPAKAYDNASWGNIQNIYQTLVNYDGASTTDMIPVLATEVPTAANGRISADGKTYRFTIRKGIKFHEGQTLTPEDVEFSFERNLVLDPDHGPNWVWWFMFTGSYSSRGGDGVKDAWQQIDKAIEVDGDDVVFTLNAPYGPFIQALAGKWASIVSKEFVISKGGWDGTEATWKDYNDPDTGSETLYDIANGTGPYKLSRWDKGNEVVLIRNEDFSGPKPALKNAIYKIVEEWSTRKLMLLQGDADIAYIPAMYYREMEKEAGLIVEKDLPDLAATCAYFNQAIATSDNPYVGSGKLDGAGISADFFADKNVRFAFRHAFNTDVYIDEVVDGFGFDPVTPIIKGLAYKNESLESPAYDMAKAEEYFKKAHGGQVWEKGFEMTIVYNTGNVTRETASKLLAEAITNVNSKFKIDVVGVEWPAFLDARRNSFLPISVLGWGADYPDPDNFAMPFIHSEGDFGGPNGYKSEEADRLISAAAVEPDGPKREEMYYRVQEIWLEDMPGIMLSQPKLRRYYRDWLNGYQFHPMESEHVFYVLEKE